MENSYGNNRYYIFDSHGFSRGKTVMEKQTKEEFDISRACSNSPLSLFLRIDRKRVSVHFFSIGALGTAHPTFQFPFECSGTGRAACPQAAVRSSFFIPQPVTVMSSIWCLFSPRKPSLQTAQPIFRMSSLRILFFPAHPAQSKPQALRARCNTTLATARAFSAPFRKTSQT